MISATAAVGAGSTAAASGGSPSPGAAAARPEGGKHLFGLAAALGTGV